MISIILALLVRLVAFYCLGVWAERLIELRGCYKEAGRSIKLVGSVYMNKMMSASRVAASFVAKALTGGCRSII